MKLIFFFVFLSLSLGAQNWKGPEGKKLSGRLFLLNDQTLITNLKIDPEILKKNKDLSRTNRILSLPIEALKKTGLKKNDVIQSISFSDGKSRQYKVGSKVFVLLTKKSGDEDRDKWASFNLILSNDVEVHKALLKLPYTNPIKGNGLAYTGNDWILKDGSYETLSFTKIPASDPKRKAFLEPKNDIKVAKTSIFSLYIDFTPAGSSFTNLIITSKDNYLLESVNLLKEKNVFTVQVGHFSDGFQFLLSLITPELECSKLYFITKDTVSYKDVFCGDKFYED